MEFHLGHIAIPRIAIVNSDITIRTLPLTDNVCQSAVETAAFVSVVQVALSLEPWTTVPLILPYKDPCLASNSTLESVTLAFLKSKVI